MIKSHHRGWEKGRERERTWRAGERKKTQKPKIVIRWKRNVAFVSTRKRSFFFLRVSLTFCKPFDFKQTNDSLPPSPHTLSYSLVLLGTSNCQHERTNKVRSKGSVKTHLHSQTKTVRAVPGHGTFTLMASRIRERHWESARKKHWTQYVYYVYG